MCCLPANDCAFLRFGVADPLFAQECEQNVAAVLTSLAVNVAPQTGQTFSIIFAWRALFDDIVPQDIEQKNFVCPSRVLRLYSLADLSNALPQFAHISRTGFSIIILL